jgi:LysR family glycine cleavage system transcriptional activator
MRPYIPSLQSLLAFEAASRHLSFTRAAQELELTQTAISHQIKTLEERLGIKLFIRRRNVLTLTPAAREYLASVNEAINMLSIATARARKKNPNTVLTVTCLPTYAVKCLIPALPDFQRAHPDITVHLATSATFDEFERNSYDVAIRYGSGRWASVRSDRLHGEEFFPVCAPSVLAEAGPFESTAEGLARFRQIRTYFYSMYQDDWPAWLEAAVQEPVEFAGEAVFHLQLTSLAAAVDGVGLAIGRTPLVDADLASGKLVQPFDVRVPSNSAYFVSSPNDKTKLKKVELFRDWALRTLGDSASRPAAAASRPAHSIVSAEQHAATCLAPADR